MTAADRTDRTDRTDPASGRGRQSAADLPLPPVEPADNRTSTTGPTPAATSAGRHPEAGQGLPVTAGAEEELGEVRTGMFGVRGSGDTSGYGRLVSPVTRPGGSQRPYGSYFDEVADTLAEALEVAGLAAGEAIERVVVDRGEITFHVRRERLVEVAWRLRDEAALRFELCCGVSGVHYPTDTGRELHAVYHLLSVTHNRRVRVEVTAPERDPRIPSLVGVYPTLDWHERETYDFFGVVFEGHPALTRIQMPDDWRGHPQRKDYPLGGIPVEYKGAQIPPPDQRRSYH